MARAFRYYGKKRGNRRSGSPTLGSLGEVGLSAVFLLSAADSRYCFGVGCCPSGVSITSSSRAPARCSISESTQKRADGGPLYRPEIRIEYSAGGDISSCSHYDIQESYFSSREGAQAVIDRFEVNKRYPCWYDPADPEVVVLAPDTVGGYGCY